MHKVVSLTQRQSKYVDTVERCRKDIETLLINRYPREGYVVLAALVMIIGGLLNKIRATDGNRYVWMTLYKIARYSFAKVKWGPRRQPR